MCEPISTIAAIGGLLSGGAAAAQAMRDRPKPPPGRQETKAPEGVSRSRRRGAGPAYGGTKSLLAPAVGQTAGNTLLGS